jgi:hypothetical protein
MHLANERQFWVCCRTAGGIAKCNVGQANRGPIRPNQTYSNQNLFFEAFFKTLPVAVGVVAI